MNCDRCCQPIRPDEQYKEHIPTSGTAAAPNVRMHEPACRSAPRQTAPAGLGR